MVNIDTHNFTNCSILPYNISIFKLNCNAWALSLATHTNEYQNMGSTSMDNPSAILNRYLDGEELEELVLKAGNVFDNDLPTTSHIDVFDEFQ